MSSLDDRHPASPAAHGAATHAPRTSGSILHFPTGKLRDPGELRSRFQPMGHEPIRAVILAGSFVWGNSMLSGGLRSPLAHVALEPMIYQPLRWLRDAGVADVTICAHQGADDLEARLARAGGDGGTLRVLADRSPRGTAGCVRDAMMQIGAERLVVVEGSILPSIDLGELLDSHEASGAVATVVVEIDRRATGPGANVPQPGGIYVFERAALERVKPTGFHDIKEGLLEALFRAGEKVNAFKVQGMAPRVLDLPTYVAVNRLVVTRMARGQAPVPDGCVREGEVVRHHTARIASSVRTVGPILVGAGVVIEDDAVLVGPAVIGANSRVERGACVARSVLWEATVVGARSFVDDSLLGHGSVVAEGERLCGDLRAPERNPDLSPVELPPVPSHRGALVRRAAERASRPAVALFDADVAPATLQASRVAN